MSYGLGSMVPIEYWVYGDLTMILGNSLFYLLKGDYRIRVRGDYRIRGLQFQLLQLREICVPNWSPTEVELRV